MDFLYKKLGLTENQAKVYLAALELGLSSMTELSQKSNLKRPTAYLIVEELMILGLLAQTKTGKRKVYSAIHPRRLVEIARNKGRQIGEVLPELVALHNAEKEKPKIQVFEGYDGVMHVYEEVYEALNAKEEALWFTNIEPLESFPESTASYLKMISRIKNPKIRELNLDNEAGRRWSKRVAKFQGKNHFVRLLPAKYEFGMTDFLIFQNKVCLFSLKKNIFVTVIESEDIAKSERAMFNWAWKMGK